MENMGSRDPTNTPLFKGPGLALARDLILTQAYSYVPMCVKGFCCIINFFGDLHTQTSLGTHLSNEWQWNKSHENEAIQKLTAITKVHNAARARHTFPRQSD